MSTDVTPRPGTRPATTRQLDWLRGELGAWSREGLLQADQAEAILGSYHASRKVSVGRLLLALGAVFVGVGAIWLVAANLDQLSPTGRFLALAVIWLALLAGGEALAVRVDERRGSRALVAAVRLLAALMFGAVVFQAAQSLQVPAWEPALVGYWSAGALVHAYAARALAPLLVGLTTGVVWFLWQVLGAEPTGLGAVLALLAAAGFAVGLSAVHTRYWTSFTAPWREVGAVLGLAGLFTAALPFVTTEDFAWNPWLVAGLAVAGAAVVAGTALAERSARLEPPAAVVVALGAIGLVIWETGTDIEADLTANDWLHALLSVGVYVVVAVGVAVLGTLRDSWRLTAVATLALVVFTTFQSFAVFAQIIQGAWLFVVLGLVLLGTGFLFDRARRQLAAAIEPTGRVR